MLASRQQLLLVAHAGRCVSPCRLVGCLGARRREATAAERCQGGFPRHLKLRMVPHTVSYVCRRAVGCCKTMSRPEASLPAAHGIGPNRSGRLVWTADLGLKFPEVKEVDIGARRSNHRHPPLACGHHRTSSQMQVSSCMTLAVARLQCRSRGAARPQMAALFRRWVTRRCHG